MLSIEQCHRGDIWLCSVIQISMHGTKTYCHQCPELKLRLFISCELFAGNQKTWSVNYNQFVSDFVSINQLLVGKYWHTGLESLSPQWPILQKSPPCMLSCLICWSMGFHSWQCLNKHHTSPAVVCVTISYKPSLPPTSPSLCLIWTVNQNYYLF